MTDYQHAELARTAQHILRYFSDAQGSDAFTCHATRLGSDLQLSLPVIDALQQAGVLEMQGGDNGAAKFHRASLETLAGKTQAEIIADKGMSPAA